MISLPKELLQTVLDIATESMDFSSGFLDDEEVNALRTLAEYLGVDPMVATPSNFRDKYRYLHTCTFGSMSPWRAKYVYNPQTQRHEKDSTEYRAGYCCCGRQTTEARSTP